MSKPVTVDLKVHFPGILRRFTSSFFPVQGLFVNFDIVSVEELSLGANKAINETQRLQWDTTDSIDRRTSGKIAFH